MADRELFSKKSKTGTCCRRWFQGSEEDRLKLWAANPILARGIDLEIAHDRLKCSSWPAVWAVRELDLLGQAQLKVSRTGQKCSSWPASGPE